MKLVIICGGIGSKMWPLSRASNPKHFAKLLGEKSLFEMIYADLRTAFAAKDICVQTNPVQAEIAKRLVPEIPKENYFIEPEMRNHGPAMGLMAAKLFSVDPDEPYMNIQSDVIRRPRQKFIAMIKEVEKLVKKEGKLMTGGIKLDRVVGGIDFMVLGEEVKGVEGMRIFRMKKWVDRDDPERNDEGIAGGQVYGHANHYAWTPRKMLEAYKRRAPDWYEPLSKMVEAIGTKDEEKVIAKEYVKMEPGRVDVRVTRYELDDALVVDLPFEWLDMGTWESVYFFEKNSKFKISNSKLLEIEGKGNYVRTKKFVATIGVSDLVVVEVDDAVLVMRREDSGKVGQVVDWLKERNKTELL